MMPKLTGGQFVGLVLGLIALFLATLVTLVALGQQLSAIIAAGTAILSGLGTIIAWLYAMSQKLNRVEANTNGSLHARDQDLKAAYQYMVNLAAAVPPGTEMPSFRTSSRPEEPSGEDTGPIPVVPYPS